MKCSEEDVINSYKELSYKDMLLCWKIIHNHKLHNLYEECLRICNAEFEQKLLKENIICGQFSTFVYKYSIKSSRYLSGDYIYITYRKKIKDIELYNQIIERLHINQRKLIQENLLNLDTIVLNDIKKINICSNSYNIIFKSDKPYENGVFVHYDDSLNDAITNYYYKRKLKRYKEYKQRKQQLLLSNFKVDKSKQIIYKRKKYTSNIDNLCSTINDCKNMQWHCTWSWWDNLNIKIKLYFDCDKEIKTNNAYYDYNYSLTFIVEEKMFRILKDIVVKHMNKLYNMSGFNSLKSSHCDFTYHRYGTPDCRKLFINSEVNNG